jgi:hypothetical protein
MWVEVWVGMKNNPKVAYSLSSWRKRSPTNINPTSTDKPKKIN